MSQNTTNPPTNARGRGKERTCPYCKTVYRTLPPHIRACDAVPSTEEVLARE